MKRLMICCVILYALISLPLSGEILSLDGNWKFITDSDDIGLKQKWFDLNWETLNWKAVSVPHTWQIDEGLEAYFGVAWYRRNIQVDAPNNGNLHLEFNAVYRDATVWVNHIKIGEHEGSGWTPFKLNVPISNDGQYCITVRVDNRFSEKAIPYLDSFDWANDGGIIRSVQMRALPEHCINQLFISTVLAENLSTAIIQCRIKIDHPEKTHLNIRVYDPSNNPVAEELIKPASEMVWKKEIIKPELWHFDAPNLYRLECCLLKGDQRLHTQNSSFGIYNLEIKNGYYWLNNEPMRLMGVEWMPGSDPRYGMAESPEYMRGILKDMKELNCIITRFHWQQDRSVFDFCDRNGLLIQEEVPTWGGKTRLEGLHGIQEMQMSEMISAHFNHPSIYAWGLCNEISGHGKEGHAFVKNGVRIARELDPDRLLTYASNQLQHEAGLDASVLVDFVEWNDYYESWYGGDLNALENNLKTIESTFPDKALVISEYGLCECSPDNPTGDPRRIEILQTHTDIYRKFSQVAGAIFFDYNDYRTHIGDKGRGAYKQRIHGVVDLFGRRKPSWDILKQEMSPVKRLSLQAPVNDNTTTRITLIIHTRSLENDMPAYTLREYDLIWTAYNSDDQPQEGGRIKLPHLAPGSHHQEIIDWPSFGTVARFQVEIYRPTGYSVIGRMWDLSQ